MAWLFLGFLSISRPLPHCLVETSLRLSNVHFLLDLQKSLITEP
jgi:hypothetical protein